MNDRATSDTVRNILTKYLVACKIPDVIDTIITVCVKHRTLRVPDLLYVTDNTQGAQTPISLRNTWQAKCAIFLMVLQGRIQTRFVHLE